MLCQTSDLFWILPAGNFVNGIEKGIAQILTLYYRKRFASKTYWDLGKFKHFTSLFVLCEQIPGRRKLAS